MPKRTDISSIMIIGAGPIVIGQACEFDYSGAQACKALKEEGYRIVLVNSNPATIMTDPVWLMQHTLSQLNHRLSQKLLSGNVLTPCCQQWGANRVEHRITIRRDGCS